MEMKDSSAAGPPQMLKARLHTGRSDWGNIQNYSTSRGSSNIL